MVGMSASMVGTGLRLHANPKTKSPFLTATPALRRRTFRVAATGGGGGPPVLERALSVAAYALPLVNCVQYGSRLFALYPALVPDAVLPLVSLYQSTPRYANFIGFIGLYVGVALNPAVFSRFAVWQAIHLDVVFVLAGLLAPRVSPIWALDGVFLLSCVCGLYVLVNCISGRIPYLPLVSDIASRQV